MQPFLLLGALLLTGAVVKVYFFNCCYYYADTFFVHSNPNRVIAGQVTFFCKRSKTSKPKEVSSQTLKLALTS